MERAAKGKAKLLEVLGEIHSDIVLVSFDIHRSPDGAGKQATNSDSLLWRDILNSEIVYARINSWEAIQQHMKAISLPRGL